MATEIRSRVVPPGEIRLSLSEGDWLLVKRRLNAGETIQVFEASKAKDSQGRDLKDDRDQAIVSPIKAGLALVTAYLLDWSFVGLDGEPLSIRGAEPAYVEAIITSFDDDTLGEILAAITAHDAAIRREKKRRSTGSSETLPSLAVVGGGMSG